MEQIVDRGERRSLREIGGEGWEMSRAKRRKSAKNLTQLYLKGLEFEFGFWLKPKKNKKKLNIQLL